MSSSRIIPRSSDRRTGDGGAHPAAAKAVLLKQCLDVRSPVDLVDKVSTSLDLFSFAWTIAAWSINSNVDILRLNLPQAFDQDTHVIGAIEANNE